MQDEPPDHAENDSENYLLGSMKLYLSSCLCALQDPEFWKDRLPCTRWIPTYNWKSLVSDVIAGITTALTVIPQGIGYARLAGLPLRYGLYASIAPGFIYCLLGTRKEITIGPTAVNSIMSFNYAGPDPAKAATLGLCAGIIEFAMGLFNLGFLFHFISASVISAFSTAVSIQVITSQVKGFFGLNYKGRGFIPVWSGLFRNIMFTALPDLAAGVISLIILTVLRRLKDALLCERKEIRPKVNKILKKTKWLLSISGNCIVFILGCASAYALRESGHNILQITGEVEGGLPDFRNPWLIGLNTTSSEVLTDPTDAAPVNWPRPELPQNIETTTTFDIIKGKNDSGETSTPNAIHVIKSLDIGVIMLPLVSLLQHLAIAKFYAGSRTVDASQEMAALGLSQILGSFIGSFPVTASFSRSAVNNSSGVRTPFGGVITGLIILLACAVLSPALAFIPRSVLSAVIIFCMIFTIDIKLPFFLAKNINIDLIPYMATFILGIFHSVEVGLLAGTLVHSLIVVYLGTRLSIKTIENEEYIVIRPNKGLFYPAIEDLRSCLNSHAETGKPVILDLTSVLTDVDFTSSKILVATLAAMEKSGSKVAVVADFNVRKILKKVSAQELKFFSTVEEAALDIIL